MKKVKKYQGGVPELMTPKMASVKTADVPLVSGTPKQVSVPKPSFSDKAGAFMGNYGGAITSAAGSLMPLLMKKPDPNAKPYKKGTNLIKYQNGIKSLTKEEGKVGKGSEYYTQSKKLTAKEKNEFRKLDAEAKRKGMTFSFKGLKYDPTNSANLKVKPKKVIASTTKNSTVAKTEEKPLIKTKNNQPIVPSNRDSTMGPLKKQEKEITVTAKANPINSTKLGPMVSDKTKNKRIPKESIGTARRK
jgi:hypothetical protein